MAVYGLTALGMLYMDKFEKIIDIPPCYISREASDKIASSIYSIAEEQANLDYRQALIQLAPQVGLTPEEAVNRFSDNAELRHQFNLRKDKTIFISPHKSVEYAGRNVVYDEIPIDVGKVIINTPGTEGKLISIVVTNDLIKEYPLHNTNKLLIQGFNETWVNGQYTALKSHFDNSKKFFLDIIYRFFKLFALFAFICMSFLEIKFLHWIKSDFTLNTPLTGLTSVITFIVLIWNYYLSFYVGAKTLQYLYPYLEFQDRISQTKKEWRWLIIPAIGAVYGGGIWAIVTMLFS